MTLGSELARDEILNLENNVIRVLVAEDHTIVREGIKQLIGLAKDLVVVGRRAMANSCSRPCATCPARWCCWTFPCRASTAWRQSHGSGR